MELSAQRTGLQISIFKIGLNNEIEDVVSSSDTISLFNPRYERATQNFGFAIGVTHSIRNCIVIAKAGYYQDYFKNTEKEAYPAGYSIANIKNKEFGIYWGLGISKSLYSNKKLFLNYGLNLEGTFDIKDYIDIYTGYFDVNSKLVLTRNTNFKYPTTGTVSIAPLWSFNYIVFNNISIGVEYYYGLQFTRINGQFNYTNQLVDTDGMTLEVRSSTADYSFNKITFLQSLAFNISYNLNQLRK